MFQVYVLKSVKNNKRYVGITGVSVEERLRQHRSGSSKWTKENGPFKVVLTETFPDKLSASKRERFLKSGHGRGYLNKLLQ